MNDRTEKFQDLTAADFADEAAPRPAGTNPATGKPFTTAEVVSAVTGPASKASEIEPSALKRGAAGAGLALTNKWRGVTGQEAAESGGLEKDTAGSFGMMIPDMIGSMAAPARVIPQMIYGAATKAAEPGNALDRGVAAVKGAGEFGAGQALASGLVRGANAATGNLTREGQVASAARGQGLDLSAGDITDSKLLRMLEEKSIGSPTAGQAGQVGALMREAKNNPIQAAVFNAYDAAQAKVGQAANELDQIVAQGNLPGVVPRKTYEAVRQIAARSPDTLNNVRDPELRAMLDAIAEYPANQIPKSTGFSKMDELRKVLGPVMAKVEMQSKSGASNVNTADANRWKQLYKAIMEDIEGWGSKAATADALAAHKTLSTTFKQEVLPLREHPLAGKIINGDYERPEDIVRDLIAPRNRSIVGDLYNRLDQGGRNAFDALRLAHRGSKEFVRGEPSSGWTKPLAIGAGLSAPAWAPSAMSAAPWVLGGLAAEQGLVHGLNTGLGKAILSGSPRAAQNELVDRAVHSGLRTALPQGALGAIRQRSQ